MYYEPAPSEALYEIVELLSSCDAALMLVSKALMGRVMIPDQGGWRVLRPFRGYSILRAVKSRHGWG